MGRVGARHAHAGGAQSDVWADRAEPLERDGLVGKLGVYATRKGGDRADRTEALPPSEVLARVRRRLDERR